MPRKRSGEIYFAVTVIQLFRKEQKEKGQIFRPFQNHIIIRSNEPADLQMPYHVLLRLLPSHARCHGLHPVPALWLS